MILLLSVLAQAVTQIDVPPRPPSPIAELPNVTVVTYPVSGETVEDLYRDIERQAPTAADGTKVWARTQWNNTARWSNGPQGCLPPTAEMTWRIEVTLPVVAEDAKAGPFVRRRFDRYVEQLAAFEHERARRVNQGMEATLERMRAAADCEGMLMARREGEAAVQSASRDFDAATARARRNLRPIR